MTYLEESYNLDTALTPALSFDRRGGKENWASFSPQGREKLSEGVSFRTRERGVSQRLLGVSYAAINYQNRYPKVYCKKH
jgi:hypothetical protein